MEDRYFLGELSDGGFITFDETRYRLNQIAIHMPSEHRLGGLASDVEIQLIHESSKGQKLILAILGEEGARHGEIQKLVDLMEQHHNHEKHEDFWALQLLPQRKGYYFYVGSETIPPCNEGISWILMADKIQLSSKQINFLEKKYSNSNRPLQPLGARKVLRSR